MFIRLHFVLKYIIQWKAYSGSLPPGYIFSGFPSFFLTSDLSSWASDLFHLLALCLVSKKGSVKYCTKFVLLKLSLTVETDHLPSTVVHARWICSGISEMMGLHVTFLVPFPG